MKKLLIVLMWLALGSSLMAQKENFRVQQAYETGGSIYKYFQIQGTGKDTSQTLDFYSTTVLKYWAGDTTSTGTDSVSLKIYIDHASLNTRADWLVSDSISITTDSTWTRYIYTDKARPTEPFMRVRVAGQAANKKLAYTKLIFIGAGWHSVR